MNITKEQEMIVELKYSNIVNLLSRTTITTSNKNKIYDFLLYTNCRLPESVELYSVIVQEFVMICKWNNPLVTRIDLIYDETDKLLFNAIYCDGKYIEPQPRDGSVSYRSQFGYESYHDIPEISELIKSIQ